MDEHYQQVLREAFVNGTYHPVGPDGKRVEYVPPPRWWQFWKERPVINWEKYT